MNNATVEMPRANVGELLKVVGLPTKSDSRNMVAHDLIRQLVKLIDDLVAISINQRNVEDFVRVRNEAFPNYVIAIKSLGSLGRIVLTPQQIDQMSWESFSEMEAEFRDHGIETLGADLTERGLFTAWTLRKIHELANEITAAPLLTDNTEQEVEKAMQVIHTALWNRFHVDCLARSINTKQAIHPGLVEPIKDGLRTVVNAYALARQWADLRLPKAVSDVVTPEWDADDEMLLGDSMHDLDRELV